MDEEVRSALSQTTRGLDDTYLRILERIDKETNFMRDLAYNSLRWAFTTKHSLDADELQSVLSTCLTLPETAATRLLSIDVIIEACSGLLELRRNYVRPIHFSVQEFLTGISMPLTQHPIWGQLVDLSLMHLECARACLTIILKMELTAQPMTGDRNPGTLALDPFFFYAVKYFDWHAVRCGDYTQSILTELEELLRKECWVFITLLYHRKRYSRLWLTDCIDTWSSISASILIHASGLIGIDSLRKTYTGSAFEKTPYSLHIASALGLTKAAPELVECGCDVNRVDANGVNALHYAVFDNQAEIVVQLSQAGADCNSQGGDYGTALQAAAVRGKIHMVRILLDIGADVNVQSGMYGNALQAACYARNNELVQTLLQAGATVNVQGGYFGSALQAACRRGPSSNCSDALAGWCCR